MQTTTDFSHPALLLIDLQEGFFQSPGLDRQRQKLVDQCNRLTAAAREAKVPVINVRTVHKKDKSTWTLKMLEDDQGYLFEGTELAQNLPGLDLSGAVEVIKRRDSAFWNTELMTLLLRHRVSSLVIAGVSSDTCISATAGDAFAANLPVAVATQAIASEDPDFEQTTLAFMRDQHRQQLMDTDELCELFQRCRGAVDARN